MALWASGKPIVKGDSVSQYFANRELDLPAYPADLCYSDRLPFFSDTGRLVGGFPAMLGAVRSPADEVLAIHRTYLTAGGYKAKLNPNKKLSVTCGSLAGAAIRLFNVRDGLLGVAEGIETAIAAALCANMPVWSAISASGMKTFQWPSSVRRLVVFADNDINNVGQDAAAALTHRARAAGLSVKVLTPSVPGTDWADVYAQRGVLA